MKKTYIKFTALLLFPALAAVGVINAQTTPASLDRTKMESIWINNTNNAAGGIIDAPERVADAQFEYHKTNGDFKYVQLGDDNSALKFHTEGGGIYENLNGMYIYGDFTYTRDDIAGAKWNAMLIDPLRGMPFFLADSTASKWKNQSYNLGLKFGAPKLFNCLYIGLGATYDVAVAAKQIDPRPYTKMSKIEVIPSAIFEINRHNFIGVDFDYYSYREDGQASNSNNLFDPQGWEIVAPGFFNQGTIGSFSSINTLRNYNANALGGGVQYGLKKGKFNLVLDGNYMYKVEDATCSYTKPRMSGTVRETKWDAGLSMQYDFYNNNILFFNYLHSDRNIDGIEYFQTYDNTYEIQSWITDAKFIRSNFSTVVDKVNVDYMITGTENGYIWKFGVDGSYTQDSYIYYVPESTRDVSSLDLNAYVTRNFALNINNALMLNIKGGYNTNLEGDLNYNGTRKNNPGYTDFMLVDYNYMCTDYAKFGVSLTYVCKAIMHNTMSLYLTGSYDYYAPSGDYFDKRQFVSCKLGLAF